MELPESTDLSAIVRQLSPQDRSRLDSSVYIEVPIRLVWKLVDVHVEITIRTNASTVRPDDTRVLEPTMSLEIGGIVVVDGVVSGHQLVDQSIAVTFEAIGVTTTLAVVRDVRVSCEFGKRITVPSAEVDTWDGIEVVGSERAVVHSLSIGSKLDTIKTFLLVADRHAKLIEVSARLLIPIMI